MTETDYGSFAVRCPRCRRIVEVFSRRAVAEFVQCWNCDMDEQVRISSRLQRAENLPKPMKKIKPETYQKIARKSRRSENPQHRG